MKIGFWRGIFDRIQSPSFDAPGAGAGGGAPAGGAAAPAGGAPAAAAAGAGGGNAPAAFEFKDDAQIKTSDGRVITGAQFREELSKSISGDYQKRYKTAYDTLLQEAKKIDDARTAGNRSRQPQNDDPLAALDLENQPLVDGRTAAQLVKVLREQGLAPIANLVQSLQKQVGDMSKQLQGTSKHVQAFNEDKATQDFEANLSKVLGKTPIKGLEDRKIDVNAPALREYARNLYLSYQPDSWRPGEFEKMLSDQLSEIVGWVRATDREHAQGAPDRLRQHFNPTRGAGAPRGDKPYQFKTARQIAQEARDMGMYGNSNRT